MLIKSIKLLYKRGLRNKIDFNCRYILNRSLYINLILCKSPKAMDDILTHCTCEMFLIGYNSQPEFREQMVFIESLKLRDMPMIYWYILKLIILIKLKTEIKCFQKK